MDQDKIFFDNVIDSILSIPLDKHINKPESINKFEFKDRKIDGFVGQKFFIQFKSGVLFSINIAKIDHQHFFRSFTGKGNGSRYILSIDINSVASDNKKYEYECDTRYRLNRLKEAFNFLNDRIELRKKKNDDIILKELNIMISKNIDKSITRDRKLENILNQ